VKPVRRLYVASALLLVFGAVLLLFLNHGKFASTFEARERARHGLLATDLAQTLEAHLALGLELEDTPNIRSLLNAGLSQSPGLLSIAVLRNDGQVGVLVGSAAPERWRDARAAAQGRRGNINADDYATTVWRLHNAFGADAGWLALDYSLNDAAKQTSTTFAELWPVGLAAAAIAVLLLTVLCPRIVKRNASDPGRAGRRIGILVAVLLLGLQCAIAWSAYHAFARVSAFDAPRLATALANTIKPELERALSLGIPLKELRGTEDWLRPALDAGPEFAQLSIDAMDGQTLYQVEGSGRATGMSQAFPLRVAGETVAVLNVGIDPRAMVERTRQVALEFATLLIIGMLISLEVLHGLNPTGGNADAERGVRLRLPLFLFFLASELPRAFLPVWAAQLASRPLPRAWDGTWLASVFAPFAALPDAVRATLPISIFLLAVALVSPLAGRYAARHGPRRLFWMGLVPAALGQILALLSDSLLSLCVARLLAGASFGCISIAAFDYIGRSGGGRARGMALYLAAYVAAGICGAGLGSLLADRAGIPWVFVAGLGFCALSAVALTRLPRIAPLVQAAKAPLTAALRQLLRQPRFLRLLLLVALPMQIVQQGLLFYWTPLALTAMGERASFVGVAMMAYFLLVIALNVPSARWADKHNKHALLVTVALALSGVAGLIGGMAESAVTIVACVALVGVAWAAGFAAQGALVLRLGERDLAGVPPAMAIGVYRMVERVGAMLAPLFAALLIGLWGYGGTAAAIGWILLACALAQLASSRKETA
jgi:predicted MFS family arabinose efflux permease